MPRTSQLLCELRPARRRPVFVPGVVFSERLVQGVRTFGEDALVEVRAGGTAPEQKRSYPWVWTIRLREM